MRISYAALGLASFLFGSFTNAQSILHFSETSGFDHQTRVVSLAMFQSIAASHGLSVVSDTDGSQFDDPMVLQQFAAVVFSNTSGDAILSAAQRANFETYMANGGSVLGIHAASDTYRHSTANGNNTGSWDFYPELLGASVQENPNHVSGTPLYSMQLIGTHASTAALPDPWSKNEEYYYWESGYFDPNNNVVLQVEETVGPNNQVNSYDAARAMSWYKELPQGGRMFYTALGHAQSNFTSDSLFIQHIEDALLWILNGATGIPGEASNGPIRAFPNPATVRLNMCVPSYMIGATAHLTDALGKAIMSWRIDRATTAIALEALPPGAYTVRIRERSVVFLKVE